VQPLVGGHDGIHGVIVVVEERADGGAARRGPAAADALSG
jgi:hypothetical protein